MSYFDKTQLKIHMKLTMRTDIGQLTMTHNISKELSLEKLPKRPSKYDHTLGIVPVNGKIQFQIN